MVSRIDATHQHDPVRVIRANERGEITRRTSVLSHLPNSYHFSGEGVSMTKSKKYARGTRGRHCGASEVVPFRPHSSTKLQSLYPWPVSLPLMWQRTCHVLRQQKKLRSSIFRGSTLPPPSSLPAVINSGRTTATLPSSFRRCDATNRCGSSTSGSSSGSRSSTSSSRKRFLSASPSPPKPTPAPITPPPPPPPLTSPPRKCRVYNITGCTVPYEQAWLWQQRLLHERMAWQREENKTAPNSHTTGSHDVLLLLEHPPVYTLGRGSSLDHLRFDPTDPSSSCGREVRRTERGGEVTWHGPGQIVGYPVLDLNFHKKDLHWYLRQLEEVSTACCAYMHTIGNNTLRLEIALKLHGNCFSCRLTLRSNRFYCCTYSLVLRGYSHLPLLLHNAHCATLYGALHACPLLTGRRPLRGGWSLLHRRTLCACPCRRRGAPLDDCIMLPLPCVWYHVSGSCSMYVLR